MHIARLPLPRPAATRAALRRLSTRPPPPPPAHQPQPTSFTAKASPRQTLAHPEEIRGMPPLNPRTVVNKGKIGVAGERGKGRDEKEVFEAFEGPSKPRLIYERPGGRELPKVRGTAPFVIALGLLGLGWGLFILHATNSERLSSSVLRQATFQLRNSKEVIALLGENVRLVEEWWALGAPWISGTINLMQGRVDLSFRIRGSKGAGTVYFTSIRPQEQGAWRIVRYKVIADDGQVIRLEDQAIRPEQKGAK
ncbi:hypothetical protein C361_06206 [Cryptococcus neoformans Tu259-1]|uniref:DUF1783-domain-containing protein n=1 Tax=Cryptococcus neoformans Tu259-1 TaxID=1230072 RepID=A0A854QCA2_CRYNE|nr:hypothetical protein C368_06106 [Cryptococcus neoformans var. grubii 125.91]OXG13016.1 hypothetical protein C361_06206 [Cryptococcus neoformans var. grubii Tu259-1]